MVVLPIHRYAPIHREAPQHAEWLEAVESVSISTRFAIQGVKTGSHSEMRVNGRIRHRRMLP